MLSYSESDFEYLVIRKSEGYFVPRQITCNHLTDIALTMRRLKWERYDIVQPFTLWSHSSITSDKAAVEFVNHAMYMLENLPYSSEPIVLE